jgi:tetratricopeptide (TPR) repeat protein
MRIALLLPALLAGVLAGAPLSMPVHAADDRPEVAPQDSDLAGGRAAIAAQNWKSAIDSFNRLAAREPKNADAQNLLGFAWRKSGNLDMAFKHYNEALRLDPSHRGAHEYIGEAYLMANNLPKAEEHLAAIDKLCFFSCAELRDLRQAIADYKRTRK